MSASTSCHRKPQESSLEMIPYYGKMSHGVILPGCDGDLGLGIGLAGCRFLCAGKYNKLLCSLSMSGAAISTRLVRALSLW